MTSDKACVYDIVHKGEVVYVGMTGDPVARLRAHRGTGVAEKGAELVVHEWYPTRAIAYRREHERQLDLRPPLCRNLWPLGEPDEAFDADFDEEYGKLDWNALPLMSREEVADHLTKLILAKRASRELA